MNTSPVKESLPELPLAWEFVYEFTVPGGVKRKLDSNRYNGSKPSRSLTVYTADQMREYGRLCALQAIAALRALPLEPCNVKDWRVAPSTAQGLSDAEIIEEAKRQGLSVVEGFEVDYTPFITKTGQRVIAIVRAILAANKGETK